MAIPPLPPSHDLVRLIRSNQKETEEALLEYLRQKPIPWNYQRARSLSPFAYAQEVPLSALKRACDAARMPQAGRTATWDVLQLVRMAGKGRSLQCHGMDDGFVSIRKDLSVRVAADFYFVENRRATVLWLQPRRGYALTNRQLAIFGSLMRIALVKGNFVDANLEILDLSVPPDEAERQVRRLGLEDLPHVSEAEVTEGLQCVADAYDTIARMDINWKELRQRGKPKDRRDDQGDFFRE
ncbi:hypothetical protein [Roseococcus pinisoli]|uniref:Uncharacterized protein n=1 Tax=Roseococcus pinisoli TaxID=2835040 RepID=A0ABS5Q978_9PROT|nr:hypothetical protein [Roseococcus pinisoli]MBS7810261.1 hypothetical protein [Roseococcus pinisoli]